MLILGVNSYFFSSSACLVDDGTVVAAVQEERLARKKLTSDFPFQSIAWCLEQRGLKITDVDAVTFPADLAIYLEHLNGAQMRAMRYRGELAYAMPDGLISLAGARPSAEGFVQQWRAQGREQQLHYVNHHLSHAAHSFDLSPFEEAAILTMDGFGEKNCHLSAMGRGTSIEPLAWGAFPHSLGMLYATMTEFLGFRPNSEEWKLMGASSYGDPERFYPKLQSLIRVEDGIVELDLSYFDFFQFHRPGYYTPKLVGWLGTPRAPSEELTQAHFDLAAATQKITEETVFAILRWLRAQTKAKNLCLGGGVFQNSVLNGKVKERTDFTGLYVPSAPDDSGGAVGSALHYIHQQRGVPRPGSTQFNYWGPAYTSDQVEHVLRLSKWPYARLADVSAAGAGIIEGGNILGWFQGAVEFGDRALGNRSILADARDPKMKDLINAQVKFREQFRPFAPSILVEHVNDYFVGAESTPFMEKVFAIRPERRAEIPAVTHVDGSGRLQTVSREQNARYYDLISAVHRRTGTPVVLNTSFNVNKEPIVASPEDALRTFAICGMDCLILEDFLVAKQPEVIRRYAAAGAADRG